MADEHTCNFFHYWNLFKDVGMCIRRYMVENLNKNNGCNINTIPVDYEKDYVEKQVIPNLARFHKFFK